MNRFNIGKFLKTHRAIMSYIYDGFGFKRGIIIATPGDEENKQPHIGYAFFDEVVPRMVLKDKNGLSRVYKEKFFGRITEIPFYRDMLEKNGLNLDSEDIKKLPKMIFENVDYPYYNDVREKGSDYDYLKECIFLAYRRTNGNFKNYYISNDPNDVQRKSHLKCDNESSDGSGYIKLNIMHPVDLNKDVRCDSVISEESWSDHIYSTNHIIAIRHKIKLFEYRALKYFKYI